MPRPLSMTVIASPFLCRVTVMESAWPLRYSSTELSTISQTRWCRPLESVEPMYMLGRLRTGSRPSRTVMEDSAVYRLGAVAEDISGQPRVDFQQRYCRVRFKSRRRLRIQPPAAGRPVDHVHNSDHVVPRHRPPVPGIGRGVGVVPEHEKLVRTEHNVRRRDFVLVDFAQAPVRDRAEAGGWG